MNAEATRGKPRWRRAALPKRLCCCRRDGGARKRCLGWPPRLAPGSKRRRSDDTVGADDRDDAGERTAPIVRRGSRVGVAARAVHSPARA